MAKIYTVDFANKKVLKVEKNKRTPPKIVFMNEWLLDKALGLSKEGRKKSK